MHHGKPANHDPPVMLDAPKESATETIPKQKVSSNDNLAKSSLRTKSKANLSNKKRTSFQSKSTGSGTLRPYGSLQQL
jgi:hypothetical protein